MDSREKSSEWPQFTGASRGTDGIISRDRRPNNLPNLTLPSTLNDLSTKLGGTVSVGSPHTIGQGRLKGPASRRGSPPGGLEPLSVTTRSVPATPLGMPNNLAAHLLKGPGTPDIQNVNGHLLSSQGSHGLGDNAVNSGDLQASLSRLPAGQYESSSLAFSSVQPGLDDSLDVSSH
jgi:hypothetical protein